MYFQVYVADRKKNPQTDVEADSFTVDERGVLQLYDEAGALSQQVAAFAPGTWLSVHRRPLCPKPKGW